MKRTAIILMVLAAVSVLPLSAQSEGSWGPVIESPLGNQASIGVY